MRMNSFSLSWHLSSPALRLAFSSLGCQVSGLQWELHNWISCSSIINDISQNFIASTISCAKFIWIWFLATHQEMKNEDLKQKQSKLHHWHMSLGRTSDEMIKVNLGRKKAYKSGPKKAVVSNWFTVTLFFYTILMREISV